MSSYKQLEDKLFYMINSTPCDLARETNTSLIIALTHGKHTGFVELHSLYLMGMKKHYYTTHLTMFCRQTRCIHWCIHLSIYMWAFAEFQRLIVLDTMMLNIWYFAESLIRWMHRTSPGAIWHVYNTCFVHYCDHQ